MVRKSIGSLPIQLLTFLALPLLILLSILSFGGVALYRIAMRNLIAEQNVRTLRGAADSLSVRLDQQADALVVLGQRVKDGDPPQDVIASLGYLPGVMYDGGVIFYDSKGRVIAASPESNPWKEREDVRDAVVKARQSRRASYIPVIEPRMNSTNIIIVTPVLSEETGLYVPDEDIFIVVGIISFKTLGLQAVLESFQVPGATVYITRNDGLIVYHSDPAMVGNYIPETPYGQAALRGESGANYYNNRQTGQMIATFSPIGHTDWALVQEQRWIETVNPLIRYSQSVPLVLIPGILIGVVAVWFSISRIVRPLQALEQRAADLAWGDFESIGQPVGGIEEIQRLQDSLHIMARQVQATQRGMHNYIATINQAQEDERARLARELHDQMIQTLIALDHREQRLKRHLQDDAEGLKILAELRRMTGQAINDLRRIIRAMRPIYLEDLGLIPSLQMLIRDLNERKGFSTSFELIGNPERLAADQEMALYRIAQEALRNARRHSKAEAVALSVIFSPEEVVLVVEDNGKGFEMPRRISELSLKGHFGLVGMFERAALIGAQIEIKSKAKSGTTLTVHLPLQEPAIKSISA